MNSTTKASGLGSFFLYSGYDLSGDTQSAKFSSPLGTFDVTPINLKAFQRIAGRRDGKMDMVSFFDPAPLMSHPVYSALPTADVGEMYGVSSAIGAPAYCMNAKQTNYDPTRAASGELTFAVSSVSDTYGSEWGVLLTPGLRMDTAATNGTSYDGGNGQSAPAVPLSTVPALNAGFIPATVVISGGTVTTILVNGVSVGTGDGTYTVPAGATIAVTYSVAPTWTWTWTSAFGAQAWLQVTAFTGTDVTIKLQDSADNSTFTDVASGAFAQTTAAHTTQRIALTNTATLRRYVRVSTVTSGGFTSATFAVMLDRNLVAGVTF